MYISFEESITQLVRHNTEQFASVTLLKFASMIYALNAVEYGPITNSFKTGSSNVYFEPVKDAGKNKLITRQPYRRLIVNTKLSLLNMRVKAHWVRFYKIIRIQRQGESMRAIRLHLYQLATLYHLKRGGTIRSYFYTHPQIIKCFHSSEKIMVAKTEEALIKKGLVSEHGYLTPLALKFIGALEKFFSFETEDAIYQ